MINNSVEIYRLSQLRAEEIIVLRSIIAQPDVRAKIEENSHTRKYLRDADMIRAEIKKIEGAK